MTITEEQLQTFFDECANKGIRNETIVGFTKHTLVSVYVPSLGQEVFANNYEQMFQMCFDVHDKREIEIAKKIGLIS